MHQNNFIVTRFPKGGAGRLFSCCLQLSPDISSWCVESLNLDKESKEFQSLMLNYFEKCFPFDNLSHLRNEPDIPYVCDFYSATYPRGEDVTIDEYVNFQKKNKIDYYSIETKKNKLINLFLHKLTVPDFLKKSIIINIVIDNNNAHETIAKLFWLKHYNIIDENTIDCLSDNPKFGNKLRSQVIKKYNNQSKIKVKSIRQFYFDNIFNNEDLIKFKNKQSIVEDQSNRHCKQEFINFSDVFDTEKCLEQINKILEKNHLRKIASEETFILLHNNWLLKQKKFLERFEI